MIDVSSFVMQSSNNLLTTTATFITKSSMSGTQGFGGCAFVGEVWLLICKAKFTVNFVHRTGLCATGRAFDRPDSEMPDSVMAAELQLGCFMKYSDLLKRM